MFEAAFYEYNMEEEFETFNVEPDGLRLFLKDSKDKGAGGFVVAPPFKESIIPMLGSLDVHSKEIAAVNTIVNASGKWKGWKDPRISIKLFTEYMRFIFLRISSDPLCKQRCRWGVSLG